MDKELMEAWPNCQTPDCENKACAARNSLYCFPCTDRLAADNSAPAKHFSEYRRVLDNWKEERK